MADTPALLTPRQAAKALGIAYPTLKHWILAGKIKSIRTPGGHHRVPVNELDAYLPKKGKRHATIRVISGRNQLLGRVADVSTEGLMAKVVIAIGDQRITSIITADAVADLGIKKGDTAFALVKATDVMIAKP
jgi:molybdopterin-binding protein